MTALITTSTIQFEARTTKGAVIRTFSDRDMALTWWAAESSYWPGARLDEVTRESREMRRTVRRPVLQEVKSA